MYTFLTKPSKEYAKIPISSCLVFLNDAIYLDACPFGTFATKIAASGHSTVLNRNHLFAKYRCVRGNETSQQKNHDITVMMNADISQKKTSLTDKRRGQIS